jgi:polyisoprenoid-binding protein YceI
MKRAVVSRALVAAVGPVLGLAVALAPAVAGAEVITFKLLPNYSRATFKSDAPLETFVGNTAAEGIQGTLVADPLRPQEAKGGVRVDMNLVKTGIEKRDADMRSKGYLDTEVEANRWVTFELKNVEIAGPLVLGTDVPAKLSGLLTVKQKPVPRVAGATLTWIKLTPEQVEAQKRFGFTADNIKVRAKFSTTFTDHGMQVPQLLIFKVNNEVQLETDLTFVRAQ